MSTAWRATKREELGGACGRPWALALRTSPRAFAPSAGWFGPAFLASSRSRAVAELAADCRILDPVRIATTDAHRSSLVHAGRT
jgi:hypothetical protein